MIGGDGRCGRAPVRLVLAFVVVALAGVELAAVTEVAAGAAAIAGAAPTGSLRIRSQPGVEVLWEGVALGQTDAAGALEIRGIPPGHHVIVLRKEGYREVETRVEIGPGDHRLDRQLDLRLDHQLETTRLSEPPRAPVPEPRPTPIPAPIPAVAAQPALPPPTSRPAAEAPAATPPPSSRPEPQKPAPPAALPVPAPQSGPADLPEIAALLGLALLGGGGIFWIFWTLWTLRRRSRSRGLLLEAGPSQPREALRRPVPVAAADFLDNLKQREAALESHFSTRRGGRQRRVIELINITPVDVDPPESDRPAEGE